jgi:hypothetical protein
MHMGVGRSNRAAKIENGKGKLSGEFVEASERS